MRDKILDATAEVLFQNIAYEDPGRGAGYDLGAGDGTGYGFGEGFGPGDGKGSEE